MFCFYKTVTQDVVEHKVVPSLQIVQVFIVLVAITRFITLV